jgi:hypothetical protein
VKETVAKIRVETGVRGIEASDFVQRGSKSNATTKVFFSNSELSKCLTHRVSLGSKKITMLPKWVVRQFEAMIGITPEFGELSPRVIFKVEFNKSAQPSTLRIGASDEEVFPSTETESELDPLKIKFPTNKMTAYREKGFEE